MGNNYSSDGTGGLWTEADVFDVDKSMTEIEKFRMYVPKWVSDILSLVEFPMATTNANQALSNIVPASTIPLATDCSVVEVESPQALNKVLVSPTLLLMFIDALRSR